MLSPVQAISLYENRGLVLPYPNPSTRIRTRNVGWKGGRQWREKYIEAHRAAWRNQKHGSQWESTLETYARPVIGDLPVRDVDTELVLRVLEPIWVKKSETATRLRGRIERILDWARVRGFRAGENP